MTKSGVKSVYPHAFLVAGIIAGCITLYLRKGELYGFDFINIIERKVVICIFAVIFDFYTSDYGSVLPEGIGLWLAAEWWIIFMVYYTVSFKSRGTAFKKMLIYQLSLVTMGFVLFSKYIANPPSDFWFILVRGVVLSLVLHVLALPVSIPVGLFFRKEGKNIPDINSDKYFGTLKERGYIISCPSCGTRYLSVPYMCYKCGSEIGVK